MSKDETCPSLRVYGYVRVSTGGQRDNTSIGVQKERITAFCVSQGWTLVEIFEDGGLSGCNTQRPEYQRMIQSLDGADMILVFKLDRISRNLKDILILIEDQLSPKDVGLKSVTEPFDSSTAEGRLMLQLLGSFAEFERLKISERVMAGKNKKAETGGFNGAPIPYGYKKAKGSDKFEIDPAESEKVLKLFRLYAKGDVGYTKLKNLTGCPLSIQAISNLLKNPFFAGKIKYRERISLGKHEPIVGERLFHKVQNVLFARSMNRKLKDIKELRRNTINNVETNLMDGGQK